MFSQSNDTRSRKGTALIIVMSLMLVFTALTGTLIVLHARRDVSEARSAERLARNYAVEAGLERARLEVIKDGMWLQNNKAKAKAVWANGKDEFTIGNYTIVVRVTEEAGIWSSVESTATETSVLVGPSTTSLAMTAKGATFFADYARFVHNGNLNIGDYASYGAKVHANGNMGIIGSYVTFYDDVTCTGKIGYSGPGKKTVTFYKSATPGVPYINLPGINELKGLAESAPAGAQIWDWDDPQFKIDFKNATGVEPKDDLESKIVYKQDKMDVEITSNGKTWTQTDADVPHDGTVYCRGPMTVSGNMSRRMSVLCPTTISIDGPLRYTDDSGDGQWVLRDKATGVPCTFDNSANCWSMKGNWNGPDFEYVEADDWDDRKPVVDGKKVTPALGIVTADTIYITGEGNDREIHAALFSSGDVVRPKVSGKKGNLWIQGCIITAGTNPVSSFFSYRCYAYDPYLYGNPPPGFPGGDAPSFKNWHLTNNRERM